MLFLGDWKNVFPKNHYFAGHPWFHRCRALVSPWFSHNTALIVTGQIKFWLKKILLFLEVKLFGLLTLKMQYFIILWWLTLGVLNLEQNMMNGAQRLRVNYYCGFYYLTSAQSVDSQNCLKTVGYWSWMYFSLHMDTR